MRHAIETAPKDGHFVILEDDADAIYDVGRWSPRAGAWLGKDDGPIKITPTHWHSISGDAYLQPHDEGPVAGDPASKRAPRRFFTPVVTVIAAATALYYVTREAAQPLIGDSIVVQSSGLPSRDTKTALPEVRRRVDGQVSPPAEETQTVQEQRAAATPAPDAPQSPGPKPSEVSAQETAPAQELGEARRIIERLKAQLQARATVEQALKQERERAAVLTQDAAAVRQEILANTAQHGRALDEERVRSAALASDLVAARREIETQTAQLRQANDEMALSKQAEIAKTERSLEQQRESVAAALADAATARQELKAGTAQHQQELDEERARSVALANELASARREIETQAAQSRQVSTETVPSKPTETVSAERSLEQQRETIAAALADAAAARQELKASAAQHDQALDEERARSAALASELVMVRQEIATQAAQSQQANAETGLSKQVDVAKTEQLLEQQRQKVAAALAEAAAAREALTASTAQHRQALDEERARSGTMASELATAQQVNEKLAVQFRLVGQQTELRRRAYEAELAAFQKALKQERENAAADAAELDAARRAAAARAQPETAPIDALPLEIASTAGTAMAPPISPELQGGDEAARMIARASLLIGQGDIGAARIVLERAAELGSARAAFMLAETYDPGILATWKTYGTRGEVTRARELYAKAQAGGIREAKARLDTLGR